MRELHILCLAAGRPTCACVHTAPECAAPITQLCLRLNRTPLVVHLHYRASEGAWSTRNGGSMFKRMPDMKPLLFFDIQVHYRTERTDLFCSSYTLMHAHTQAATTCTATCSVVALLCTSQIAHTRLPQLQCSRPTAVPPSVHQHTACPQLRTSNQSSDTPTPPSSCSNPTQNANKHCDLYHACEP